jgi:hypothetical protein
VLGFDGANRSMRLVSTHPGVDVADVQDQTGFALDTTDTTISREPTDEELKLLREVIDPDGIRDKEVPS